ncbi:hypothetical protein [Mycoplasma sp. P36-A1]|uniref:hypothetical protein n=1 Tax=Mycoplasma sp. P36-A1 TaxID=3252900 RepID=UPI003C2CF032
MSVHVESIQLLYNKQKINLTKGIIEHELYTMTFDSYEYQPFSNIILLQPKEVIALGVVFNTVVNHKAILVANTTNNIKFKTNIIV